MNRLNCREVERDESQLQAFLPERFVLFQPRWEPGSGRAWEEISDQIEELSDRNGVLDLTSADAQAILSTRDPSWPEYLASLSPDVREHADAARSWLLARAGGIPTADEWCNKYCLAFSDGRILDLGWRAWAQFASACVDRRESFLRYYDRETCQAWAEQDRCLTSK